jgi:P4 family phage/plasmid primase-like protien
VTLGPAHVAELQASTIDPAVAAERGYLTITEDMRDTLTRSRVPGYATDPPTSYPGLLIPMYPPGGGDALSFQFKPAEPVPHPSTGKPLKYVSRRGTPNMLDVHPRNAAAVRDVTVPLWITEGVKKADALTSRGRCVVALTGVYNFRSKTGTLGDWEDVPLRGRTVVICYDSDARSNDSVLTAMRRIGTWLKSKGAAAVWYIVVPPTCHGAAVKGADDWFAAGGTIEELESVATDYVPNSGTVQDPTFTDAYLAATVADDALGDQFLYSPGLGGWQTWDGRRWARCGTETVIESVREYAVRRYQDAVAEFAKEPNQNRVKRALDGWRTVLTRAKLTSLEFLCRGICLVDAEEFDSHNDLLNVGNGVVDLTTGTLLPHDPELHMTKLAPAKYVPGADHRDWKASLESLPPETHDWWQLRLGQAATGYMTPDDKLVLVTGGGENGKSSMMDAVGRALGDYYVQVSHRALLSSNDAHPTELMDFKGARLALIEETPEERRLNATRLKQTVGTPRIKARYMRADSATFDATHSLFLSTQFPPTVDETDHGTWRRLVRIDFPYTWLLPGKPSKPNWIVRPADPGLRQRMKEGLDGQHEAILAWLVAGAREWYQRDRVMPPEPGPVDAATAEWRGKSDTLGEYVADRLEYDQGSWITSVDLLTDLNYWLKDHGQAPWSDRLLATRMPDVHSLSMKKIAIRSDLPGRSTRLGGGGMLSGVKVKAWVAVRFRS